MNEYAELSKTNLSTIGPDMSEASRGHIYSRALVHATLAMVEELHGIRSELTRSEITGPDNDDSVHLTREEFDRLKADAQSLESIKEANRWLEAQLELHQDRCPSCDHISGAHTSDGCAYEVRDARQYRIGGCPCDVAPERTP